MSQVKVVRWWLTGPRYWSADLLDAKGEYVRPDGYDAPIVRRIERGCETREEAFVAAAPAVLELALEHGAAAMVHDETATTMTWDPEER